MIQHGGDNPFLKGKPAQKHLSHVLWQEPDPLEGLDSCQRASVAREIGSKAKEDFERMKAEVCHVLRSSNVLQLLAHFGYYDQLWLAGTKSNDDYTPVEQSAVEWMQALVLQLTEAEVQTTLNQAPNSETVRKANEYLRSAQRAFGLMRLGQKHDESGALLIAEQVRQHTAFVRNQCFPSQAKRIMQEIFTPIDAEFSNQEGYSLRSLADALWKLHAMIEKRINADLARRKEIFLQPNAAQMIDKFCEKTGDPIDQVKNHFGPQVTEIKTVRVGLTLALDQYNFQIFYFSDEEFKTCFQTELQMTAIHQILDQLSLTWGALAKIHPDHLILQNPVWTRPLIHVGNRHYFIPIVNLIQSFGLEMVEAFIRPHATLWKKYCDEVRSEYLEDRTEQALRGAFPDADIYRGLRWMTASKQQGENDVLVILDTHALVFECKSGRVRERARRGDVAALHDEIGKLMDDPAKQGGHFADFLMRQTACVKLRDERGAWHEIDCPRLMRATTVNVVLDHFGLVTTQQLLLRKAGFISADVAPSATIPLHDLECVLEILDRPAFAFHYLRRRAEIESSNNLHSSELGLLAMYLANAFDLGNFEGDQQHRLTIPTLDEQLTPYFMGKEIASEIPKPERRLCGWWSAMLESFEKRKFLGWIESSYVLLSIRYERQEEFDHYCKRLAKGVCSNWHTMHNDTCMMASGPKHRRTVVLCVAVKNKSRIESLNLINQRLHLAMEQEGPSRVLAICISAENESYPYLGVYFYAPDLENRITPAVPFHEL